MIPAPAPFRQRGARPATAVLALVAAVLTMAVATLPAADAAQRRTTRRTTTTRPPRKAAPTTTTLPASTATAPAPPETTAPASGAPADPTVTTTTAAPAASAPAPGLSQASATWSACGSIECGTLVVPLDYASASGPTVTVATARRRATDTANRIGVLIVNPGGPGGSAVSLVRSTRFISSLPPEIPARFDIVGIDPRGIRGSVEVSCRISAPSRGTPRDEASRAFASACSSAAGSVLPHVGTDSAAQDIEAMRVVLGEQQISFLGFSYGTYLGTLYAQRFPDRLRAGVLDAAVDGSVFGLTFMQDQMRAYERTLGEFLTWCQATPARCGFATVTADVRTRYDDMQFIAARGGIGRERIDKEDLEFLVSRLLGESWSTLGRVLADLSRGSTTTTISFFDSISGDPVSSYADGSWESIACRDGLTPSARPADPGDRLSLLTSVAPHFTDIATYWATEQICSQWAAPARERVTPGPTAVGRLMVIGNTLDVRTPIEWAQRLATQLGAPLVTYESYRHTAAGAGDACVNAAVSALLTSVTLPTTGVVCSSSAR